LFVWIGSRLSCIGRGYPCADTSCASAGGLRRSAYEDPAHSSRRFASHPHRATTAGRPDGGHVIDLKDHPCVGVRGVSSQLIQASSQVIPAITEYSQRSAAL